MNSSSRKTDILSLLTKAILRRRGLLQKFPLLRLFDGEGDGLDGLYIDKLGTCCVVHFIPQTADTARLLSDMWQALANILMDSCSFEAIYLWTHSVRPSETEKLGSRLLAGKSLERCIVEEQSLRFELRPAEAVNAGVFVDTRDLRKSLVGESAGKRVLNTFCYTGLLGLAAWAGGAREVTQVDISKSALSWAKINFDLNQHCGRTGAMRFIPEHCMDYFAKESRRIQRGKEPFDIVIVDPPSFGAGKSKAFSLKRDFDTLVLGAISVLAPNGLLYLTCNLREFCSRDMLDRLNSILAIRAIRSDSILLEAPKEDFFASPAKSISVRGLKTFLVS